MIDYLIVGSGFYGAICAYELAQHGFKVLVLEARDHIGGNCYTKCNDDINIHMYGPHIFHTSNTIVWNYIQQFASFNNFSYRPIAYYKGEVYSLPFNMHTFSKMWNIVSPAEAKHIIDLQKDFDNPTNLEQQAINLVGKDVYNKLIKGYTEKQWRKPCHLLPKEIIKRLPVRFTYDDNYFNDTYQGIPIGGYTQIFDTMLSGIDVELCTDYHQKREYWNSKAKHIIYTGPIDAYYDYSHGYLEYKTTRFEHQLHYSDNLQGIAVVNYTDVDVPYTRTIEHKHFEPGKSSPVTWVSTEYPAEYRAGISEPYYPVNDAINNSIYDKYKSLNSTQKNVTFGGRLAEYKYYDMHVVIAEALKTANRLCYRSTEQ